MKFKVGDIVVLDAKKEEKEYNYAGPSVGVITECYIVHISGAGTYRITTEVGCWAREESLELASPLMKELF